MYNIVNFQISIVHPAPFAQPGEDFGTPDVPKQAEKDADINENDSAVGMSHSFSLPMFYFIVYLQHSSHVATMFILMVQDSRPLVTTIVTYVYVIFRGFTFDTSPHSRCRQWALVRSLSCWQLRHFFAWYRPPAQSMKVFISTSALHLPFASSNKGHQTEGSLLCTCHERLPLRTYWSSSTISTSKY
jgi:hypothetical protein